MTRYRTFRDTAVSLVFILLGIPGIVSGADDARTDLSIELREILTEPAEGFRPIPDADTGDFEGKDFYASLDAVLDLKDIESLDVYYDGPRDGFGLWMALNRFAKDKLPQPKTGPAGQKLGIAINGKLYALLDRERLPSEKRFQIPGVFTPTEAHEIVRSFFVSKKEKKVKVIDNTALLRAIGKQPETAEEAQPEIAVDAKVEALEEKETAAE